MINSQAKTILVVEQNLPQITDLAYKLHVLEEGQITFEGNKNDALNNDHLKEFFWECARIKEKGLE